MNSRRTSPDAFLDRLSVEQVADGKWRLTRELSFWSGRLGRHVYVPEGFKTDFASVPRLPIVFLLSGDTARAAAVVHDWLYRQQNFRRRTADAVFRDAMAAGTPPEPRWRRWVMWAGVRVFGWIAWRENRRENRRARREGELG